MPPSPHPDRAGVEGGRPRRGWILARTPRNGRPGCPGEQGAGHDDSDHRPRTVTHGKRPPRRLRRPLLLPRSRRSPTQDSAPSGGPHPSRDQHPDRVPSTRCRTCRARAVSRGGDPAGAVRIRPPGRVLAGSSGTSSPPRRCAARSEGRCGSGGRPRPAAGRPLLEPPPGAVRRPPRYPHPRGPSLRHRGGRATDGRPAAQAGRWRRPGCDAPYPSRPPRSP